METAPSPRASRATRHAHTVAFVNPGRGSCPYHSKNSSSPRLYTRRVIGDETLSSTNPFHLRQSVGCGTTIKSVIYVLLMGDIGSHVDITSRRRGHQAKLGRAVAGSMTAAIVAASLTPEPVDAFLRCDRHHDQSCNRIGPQ